MKNKFTNLLNEYLNDNLSLNNYIQQFKNLDREREIEKSENLINKIDPRLKLFFDELKPHIEELTDLIYSGIYDSFEDKNTTITHYHIKFQHKLYHNVEVNLQMGSGCSQGTGENEILSIRNPNKLTFGFSDGACHYSGGDIEIDDKDILFVALCKILNFHYRNFDELEFNKNFKTLSNEEIYNYLAESDKFYF